MSSETTPGLGPREEDLQLSAGQDAGQRLGREVLTKVTLCLKQATVHSLNNAAMKAPIEGLLATVNPSLQSGEGVNLQVLGESFFFNGELIKLDFNSYESGTMLRDILRRFEAQEVAFLGPMSEPDLREFLAAFQERFRSESKKMLGQVVGKVRLRAIKASAASATAALDERQNVVRSYALAAVGAQEVIDGLKAGKPPRLARLRRALQRLADASVGHESLLVGVTRFPGLNGSPNYHLAAVAALTLLMGRRLGLPRPVLGDLSLAALLHDVALPAPTGEGGVVQDLEAYGRETRRAPLDSLLKLCGAAASGEVLGLAATAFECCLPAGGAEAPGPFAKVIAVACAFDRLTSPPPPHKGMLPDQALRSLQDRCPSRFDPRVVQLFAATVGLFPVGSTVKLTSGEVALVLEAPSDPALFDRPRVKVVRDARGNPADQVVDLAEPSVRSRIASHVDPVDAQVDVPQLLLA